MALFAYLLLREGKVFSEKAVRSVPVEPGPCQGWGSNAPYSHTESGDPVHGDWHPAPLVADGWPVDIVAGVKVKAITVSNVIVRTRHYALLQADIQSITPEHSRSCNLSGKLI